MVYKAAFIVILTNCCVCAFMFGRIIAAIGTSAIECYDCSSDNDPRCGDPFDPYTIGMVNCSLKPPLEHLPGQVPKLCRKTTQKSKARLLFLLCKIINSFFFESLFLLFYLLMSALHSQYSGKLVLYAAVATSNPRMTTSCASGERAHLRW